MAVLSYPDLFMMPVLLRRTAIVWRECGLQYELTEVKTFHAELCASTRLQFVQMVPTIKLAKSRRALRIYVQTPFEDQSLFFLLMWNVGELCVIINCTYLHWKSSIHTDGIDCFLPSRVCMLFSVIVRLRFRLLVLTADIFRPRWRFGGQNVAWSKVVYGRHCGLLSAKNCTSFLMA